MAFDITIEDITVPGLCPLTNTPLRSHDGVDDGGGPRHDSPTLDRVYPHLGYIKGNVRVVSLFANLLKHNEIDADVLSLAASVFTQRIHSYLDGDQLYADISGRHRDQRIVERANDGSLHLAGEPRDEDNPQLSFAFTGGSHRSDE